MSDLKERYRVFSGPNQFADYKCMTLIYPEPIFGAEVKTADQEQLHALRSFFPNNSYFSKIESLSNKQLSEVICELAIFIQTEQFDQTFRYRTGKTPKGNNYIALSYSSLQGVYIALQLSFNLVRHVIGQGIGSKDYFLNYIKKVLVKQEKLQPSKTPIMMMNAALRLGIPVYHYQDSSNFICLGQGIHSVVFKHASSEYDSGIGVAIQQDKYLTTNMLKFAGFPGTEQLVVKSYKQAKSAAIELGYPVAVKPVAQGQGFGVNANIQNEQELEQAFKHAAKYNSYAVLVEKHVEGLDHRLTVAGGELIGAFCRVPAYVTGDGSSSIEQLIEVENNNRGEIEKRQSHITNIVIDNNLEITIGNLGFTLESIPTKDELVYLRTNSNLSTGGTYKNVLDSIHPDTARIAVEIAKYFRLDVVGVDFMTKDIAVSWREQGAFIEINTTPGVLKEYADIYLSKLFRSKNGGRINTYLLVDVEEDHIAYINKQYSFSNSSLAYVSDKHFSLGGLERNGADKSIAQRCLAFLTDPSCETLLIAISTNQIKKAGLPVDYFSSIVVNSTICDSSFCAWLENFCDEVVEL